MLSSGEYRFEKSLYDLIRGVRNHRGSEANYIQHSIRECRTEITSCDMEVKASALLKLIYLEMFGYDMSWASFYVLEVMSSQKLHQKQIGYLGAVQSFRRDTEVLLLATNMLKKDILSPFPSFLSLPLVTMPHICDLSLAQSLYLDVLGRLTHALAEVRKKAIATLLRLSLAYPDCLRIAWPKLRALLSDHNQGSSIFCSIINFVCELGHMYTTELLGLAPRLFELLVEDSNNWMTIKLIKLFSLLISYEPRLRRKLYKPLKELIIQTTAMSLLYECINCVIDISICEPDSFQTDDEHLLLICVGKLEEMIRSNSDPNLKYVALLAFHRLSTVYPNLVNAKEELIWGCIEDRDMSMRLLAIDLSVEIAKAENAMPIVHRLLRQLNDNAKHQSSAGVNSHEITSYDTSNLLTTNGDLEDDYRLEVLVRLLEICKQDDYQAITCAEWYLTTLVQLLKLVPDRPSCYPRFSKLNNGVNQVNLVEDIIKSIGNHFGDMTVKYPHSRPSAVKLAYEVILDPIKIGCHNNLSVKLDFLKRSMWLLAEYVDCLDNVDLVLEDLLSSEHSFWSMLAPETVLRTACILLRHSISSSIGSQTTAQTTQMVSSIAHQILRLSSDHIAHSGIEVQEYLIGVNSIFLQIQSAIRGKEKVLPRRLHRVVSMLQDVFPLSDLCDALPRDQHEFPVNGSDFSGSLNNCLGKLLNQSQLKYNMDSPTSDLNCLYFHSEILPVFGSQRTYSGNMKVSDAGFARTLEGQNPPNQIDLGTVPILNFDICVAADEMSSKDETCHSLQLTESALDFGNHEHIAGPTSVRGGEGLNTKIIDQKHDEIQVARALEKLERDRLAMQRDFDRISARDERSSQGIMVKKKRKKIKSSPNVK